MTSERRPRPYAARPRRSRGKMPQLSREHGETSLRPLTASLVAAGVMTIGVLQFLGDIWGDIPPAARHGVAIATRIASLSFLALLALAVAAWLARESASRRWLAAANVLAAVVFGGGAFIVTREISRALSTADPAVGALPGGGIETFVSATVLAPLVLILWLLGERVVRALRRGRKP